MPQTLLRAIVPAAGYYSQQANPASLETEVLLGECVQFIKRNQEYLQVRSEHYATPGFVRADQFETFDPKNHTATHRVIAPATNSYHAPSFKTGVSKELPFNARLVATGASEETSEGCMLEFADAGWIPQNHVRQFNKPLHDYVEVARSRLRHTGPYTWGSRAKPDCSALVMDALLACGILCPRNVSEQAKSLGMVIQFGENFSNLKKGDFVFWLDPGTKARHVVIMTSQTRCVHSTIQKPYCGVIEQPLSKIIGDQMKSGNGRPTIARRFTNYRF